MHMKNKYQHVTLAEHTGTYVKFQCTFIEGAGGLWSMPLLLAARSIGFEVTRVAEKKEGGK